MSYCYADDDTSPPTHHYHHHLMPESPLQHKLSSSSTTSSSHVSRVGSTMSPNSQLEHEKRVRREIANSNERRRMQSINTGFQSLKILIPHSCGEKLSKACILQRAADHIKSLEQEKLKLQSQNEQFRVLIKSFQIDSTSVLQAQRRLSTTDPDETVLLLGNSGNEPTSNVKGGGGGNNNNNHPIGDDDISTGDDQQLRIYHDVKNRHWQTYDNVQQYVQAQKDEQHQPRGNYYSTSSYRTVKQTQNLSPESSPTTVNVGPTPDTAYMILKPAVLSAQPIPRSYKTGSLDQHRTNNNNNNNETDKNTNTSGIVIVERCHLRAQSVDTNNNSSSHPTVPSSSEYGSPMHVTDHAVSRRNLQTIVEAIRHLEGDEVLAGIAQQQQPSSLPRPIFQQQQQQHADLPAQLKAMINEKFQQQAAAAAANKSPPSTGTTYQQTINIYEQVHQQTNTTCHDVDLHQKPPKKRKITYNESDDTIEQQPTLLKLSSSPDTGRKQVELPPISSPDVHHHEQISSESPPTMISNLVVRSSPMVAAQLFPDHLIQRAQQTNRFPPPPPLLTSSNLQQRQQQP